MAEKLLDSLLIHIGVNADEVKAGIHWAAQSFENLRSSVEATGKPIDGMVTQLSKGALLMGQSSDAVSQRIMEIGSTGQKTALVVGKAFDGLGKKLGGVASLIGGLAAPIMAVFGGGALFQAFTQDGQALAQLSDRIGVSAKKIDAWAKANEDAGGSQEAFRSALENFILTTGKGEDEFFRMGEHIKGLNQRQAEYFLQTQGLSYESAAVFLKYRDAAEQAADAFNDVAMTDEQVKIAAEFNTQWGRFTLQAQSLGGILMTAVMPVFTKVMDWITSCVKFLNEHKSAVRLFLTGIAAIIGGALLMNVVKAAQASSTFMGILKGGIPVAKAFSAAISANPLGALIAALGAVVLIADDFMAFLRGGNSLIEKFMTWCGLSAEEVDNVRQNIISFGKAVAGLPEKIISGLKGIWSDFEKIGSAIKNALRLDSFFSSAKNGFDGLVEFVNGVFSGIWDGLKSGFVFIDTITTKVSKIPDAFVKGFDNGSKYLYDNFLSWFVEPVRDALSRLWDGIGEKASVAWNEAKASFAQAWTGVKQTIATLWDGISDGAAEAGQSLLKALMYPVEKIKAAIESLFDVAGNVKKKLSGAFDSFKSWLPFGGGKKEEETKADSPGESAAPRDPRVTQNVSTVTNQTSSVSNYDQRQFSDDHSVVNNTSSVTNVQKPEQTAPRRKTRLEQYGERRGQYDWLYEALKVMDEADRNREAMMAANSNIAAQHAGRGDAPAVNNDVRVTVENHIQTADNPQAISRAVGQSVTAGANRAANILANAPSGVNQK